MAFSINIFIGFFLFSIHLLPQCGAGRGGGGTGRGGGGGGGSPSGGGGSPSGGGGFGGPPPSAGRSGGTVVSGPAKSSGGRGLGGLGTGLAVGAVGGLAAGVLASQVAHSISQGSSGGYVGSQYYYYGDRNYPGQRSGFTKCVLEMGGDFNATYKDGKRITELVYDCDSKTSTCCSSGCCPITYNGPSAVPVQRTINPWAIIIPLIILVIAIALVCFFVIRRTRRSRTTDNYASTVTYETNGSQPVIQQDGPKQWAPQYQPQQQPYYPAGPPQQTGYYPPAPGAPPPSYPSYGYQPQPQPQQPYPSNWRPS